MVPDLPGTYCRSRAWPSGALYNPFRCFGFAPVRIVIDFLRIFLNQETFGDLRRATVSLELQTASLALECGYVHGNFEQHTKLK